MGRKLAREEAMKLIFQMDMNNEFLTEVLEIFLEGERFNKEEADYINKITGIIIENKEIIDEKIGRNSNGWKINRIANVDLATLRIATGEILFIEDIPTEVSINEALEICKKYSTSKSTKFVNGLLGTLVRGLENTEN